MAGIADYSSTAASNTAVGGVDIQGSAAASNIDNALRAIMADIATALAAGTFSATGYVAKSAGYTVLTTDRGKMIDCTATLELDLPAAATAGAGFMFWIKANGGTVTVDPDSTENINGSSTSATIVDGSIAAVVCTGTAWHTMSGGNVTLTGTQTLSNKTLTLPQINDTSSDHQYVFAVSELAADRTVTLPLLASNDEFVFKAHNIQAEATWTTGTGTTESLITPAKAKAAAIAAGGGAPDCVLEDQKAAGTAGGTATSGSWQTRTLNTEVRDNGGIISISSNEFTPTVAGWVEWSAPALGVDRHQSRLYNVTGAAVVAYGVPSESAGVIMNHSGGGAAVAANTAYRIEHQVETTNADDGYGQAGNFAGTEVYTRVKFWRTA